MSNRLKTAIYGAVAGGFAGLLLLVYWTGRTALGSIGGVTLAGVARGRSEFVVSSGGLYFLVAISAVIGGLAIAGLSYTFGRESEPHNTQFPLRYVLPMAAMTAALTAYAAIHFGLDASGTITEGVVTVSVSRMTVLAAVSGAIAGSITASTVDALARPAVLGLEGEAWPTSRRAFVSEMIRAIRGPIIATTVIAALALSLSKLLLSLHGAASVAVFSALGAIVLGGAAFAAYRPWNTPN